MTTTRQPGDRLPRGSRPGRAGSRPDLTLEALEDRLTPSDFTLTSPTSRGALPAGASAVGGIVLDLVGANGRRVVSQLSAGALFRGEYDNGTPVAFRGNPGTIGIQTGFTAEVLSALGGGLSEVAVRLTVFDGDVAAGNFDAGDNALLLNGVSLGDFSAVATQTTNEQGQDVSGILRKGFANERLDTGFFYSNDPATLSELFIGLVHLGQVVYQLRDDDPFDNFFDFTLGIDGDLIDVGSPPVVVLLPPQLTLLETTGPTDEGSPVTVRVTAVDPDGAGQPMTFDFDLDGDGVFETSNTTGEATRVFADEGSYEVVVRVRDADGEEASGTIVAEVRNLAPSLADVSWRLGADGSPGTLSFDARDPGDDELTLVVDWGDGRTTSHAAGLGVAGVPAGLSAGPHLVTLTLLDGDGGEAVTTFHFSVPEPLELPVSLTIAPPTDAPVPVVVPVQPLVPAAPQPAPATPTPSVQPAESPAVMLNALLVAMREDVRGDGTTQPPTSPAGGAADAGSGSVSASAPRMPSSGGGGSEGEASSDAPPAPDAMPPTRRSEPPPIPTPAPADPTPQATGTSSDVANALRQALEDAQKRFMNLADNEAVAHPQQPAELVPVTRPAGAVHTVLLLMAALLIHRAWATSAASPARLLRRRRLDRQPPAIPTSSPTDEPPAG